MSARKDHEQYAFVDSARAKLRRAMFAVAGISAWTLERHYSQFGLEGILAPAIRFVLTLALALWVYAGSRVARGIMSALLALGLVALVVTTVRALSGDVTPWLVPFVVAFALVWLHALYTLHKPRDVQRYFAQDF